MSRSNKRKGPPEVYRPQAEKRKLQLASQATADAAAEPQFRVEVDVGEATWARNQLTYPTRELAESAAQELYQRWTAVRAWRVVEVMP